MTIKKIIVIFLPVLVIWVFYRYFFVLPEWFDEILIKPLVFVLIPLNLSHMRRLPGFEKKGNVINDILLGTGLAFFFAFAAIYANIQKYGVFTSEPLLPLAGGGLIFYLFLSLITSFSEEVFGRGMLFTTLKEKWGVGQSAILSSVLMLMLYIPIVFTQLNLTGPTLIVYFSSVFLLSIVNCFIYENRKSLILPILIHTFWNMSVALFI